MIEAAGLLKAYGLRLKEVSMSEVPSNTKHEAMSLTAVSAIRKVAHLIPRGVPIILESVISPDKIEQEIKLAEFVLSRSAAVA
jgi:predicted ABC-type ATPase